MSNISDKAVVDPKAKIGNNVTIMPFAYIEGDVVIGDECVIYPFVSIMNGTRMGKRNFIHQNAVIGAIPQDFSYKGDPTVVEIGDDNIIRENVVINRATFTTGKTTIGNGNFIMEGAHLSHDVHIGNENVLGYGTKIAGDVDVEDYTIFSSNVIANPGVRVGEGAMIQSSTTVSKDVPPYIVAGGTPVNYGGVNSYVLKQINPDQKVENHVANAYRLIFNGQTSVFDAVNQVEQQVPAGREVDHIVEFCRATQLGIISKM